jgi:hypothetical protein
MCEFRSYWRTITRSIVPTAERAPWEPLLTEESVESRSKYCTTPPWRMSYLTLGGLYNDQGNEKRRKIRSTLAYIYVATSSIKYNYVDIYLTTGMAARWPGQSRPDGRAKFRAHAY